MKRIVYIILLLLLFPLTVSARDDSIEVTFNDCIDGDTAKFNYNDEVIKVRFLAIDTPETKHPTKGVEEYGKEASEYTCNALKSAKKIVLEFDSNSDELDKYDRYLAWVFVDDKLIENELINLGYGKVAYLYGDYKYTSVLTSTEEYAKKNKLGIWSLEENITTEEDTNIESTNDNTNDSNEDSNKTLILLLIFILICPVCKKGIQIKRKR